MQDRWASTLWARVHWKILAFIVVPTLFVDVLIYCLIYPRPAVVGLLGDLYNFGAGIWFARDLLFKDQEAHRRNSMGQLMDDIKGRNFPVVMDGLSVNNPTTDLEKVFNRRKAGEALSACLMLGLGLALILLARVLELVEQGRVEMMWEHFKGIGF